MEAKDLRIGNYLRMEETDYQVSTLHSDNTLRFYSGEETIGCFGIAKVKPIPLTEEWLLKFGFKSINSRHFRIRVKNRVYEYALVYNTMGVYFDGTTYYFSDKTKHVHQLQNLYFALTGEELTIKES